MTTITALALLTSTEEPAPFTLRLDSEGVLVSLEPAREALLENTLLVPALLDIHTHGAVGEDVMSATPEGFRHIHRFFAQRGVGWYLPTTVTAAVDTTLRALERIATEVERSPQPGEAQPLGIHLEGPFLSHVKRGVHPTAHLLAPDVALFDRFQQAARGAIRLLTLAPELPGAIDLIRHVTASGVRVALGHTNALATEALAAIEAGASGATHTFNAMRPLDHREPGVVGIALSDDRLYSEIIADTVHVAPPLLQLWHRAKGRSRAVLVTDSMQAAGAGVGRYTLGGLPVTVSSDRALLSDDLAAGKETLAGSILTLDKAVGNLLTHSGCSLADAARAASWTPAELLGLKTLPALTPDKPASFNLFSQEGTLLETWIRGQKL